jgi:hypothetical protein
MLKTIKNAFKKLFAQAHPLEQFIMSKNPQSPAEVEHWARIYSHKNGGWIL